MLFVFILVPCLTLSLISADLSDKQENQQDYELEHKIYGPAIVEATRLHEDSRLIYGTYSTASN